MKRGHRLRHTPPSTSTEDIAALLYYRRLVISTVLQYGYILHVVYILTDGGRLRGMLAFIQCCDRAHDTRHRPYPPLCPIDKRAAAW